MSGERLKLAGETRERTGTRYSIRLRKTGKLPAVIYGHGQDPTHIAIDRDQVEHALHAGEHLLDIDVAGQKPETCLIKDIQYDFLGDHIIHIDLARVDLSEEVAVNVPIELKGEDNAPGLKADGAILETPLTDLAVKCRADSIPHEIIVDASMLNVGESITVGDLALPAGVTAVTDEDSVVASISITQTEEELEAELEGAGETTGDEPEVISEAREEDEGDGGGDEGAAKPEA